MTVSDQAKLTLTLKGGSGFDAPWIVLHSDTPEAALATLNDASLKELMSVAQSAAKHFVSQNQITPSAPAASNGQPAGASQAPNGQTPPAGYVFKSGVGKTGKAWKAFMPANRDSGLEVIWL